MFQFFKDSYKLIIKMHKGEAENIFKEVWGQVAYVLGTYRNKRILNPLISVEFQPKLICVSQ